MPQKQAIEVLEAADAAEVLDCGASYIYTLIQSGRIRHTFKRARVFVIAEADGTIPIADPGTHTSESVDV